MLARALAEVAGVQNSLRLEWPGLERSGAALAGMVVALAGILAVAAFYRRERAASGPGLRYVCCGLRTLCLGVLGAILLRPSVARDTERLVPARVVILADRSASMSVQDANLPSDYAAGWKEALRLRHVTEVGELTRHEMLRKALEDGGGGLVAQLRRANQVELMAFAEDARVVSKVLRQPVGVGVDAAGVGSGDTVRIPDWKPTGVATDMAGALRAALGEGAGGMPAGALAAVIVLSDGQDTEGGDLGSVAQAAASRGIPLHFVGLGSPLAVRNVEVLELFCGDHAVRGLPFEMRAFFRSQGYEGQAARLVLSVTDPLTGRKVEALMKEVLLEGRGQRQAAELAHVPEAAGAVRYEVAVEPLEGESRVDDNAAGREVLVTDERIKVLLLAGGPSREYRFLKSAIGRDPAFALTASLYGAAGPLEPETMAAGSGPGAERADVLPSAGAAPLSGQDVVLLCDPAVEQLPAAFVEGLAEQVERDGLGVVYVAGPAYSPMLLTDPAYGRLRDLLPVVVDDHRAAAFVAGPEFFTEERPVELDREAVGHPIVRMGEGSQEFWSLVPPLYWVFPASRAKAGATVLLRCADGAAPEGAVLAAAHSYGLGRALYCGSSETWRWRQRGIAYYERFWLQALRYCAAGRMVSGDRRARIVLERSVYALGEPIRIRATLSDAQIRPLTDERTTLAVERDGRLFGAVELGRRESELGQYEGTFYPEDFGRFELVYSGSGGLRVAQPLEVRRPDVEFRDLRLAGERMEDLAAKTGGRYFAPWELGQVPSAIPDRSRTITEAGPLEPLWDTPYLLGLLCAALVAEWVMRKRMGLL